ncbi:MAG: FixH family protein [Ghiorsea sp.]
MTKPNQQPQEKALKSPYIWAGIALLVIVFGVNYAFYSVAQTTTSGLVNEEYYKYGLQQNKIDKQFRKQDLRGWKVELNMPKEWEVNQTTSIGLTVTDSAGKPLSGGIAEVTAYRPSDAKADVIKQLVETKETGIYQAEITLPLPGVWDINLLFTMDDQKHMLNKRISINGDGSGEDSTLEKIVKIILP